MAFDWYQQGPMNADDASRLAERYRQAGRKVNVIPWFNPGDHMVSVLLPVMNKAPRQSRIYQNKLWK